MDWIKGFKEKIRLKMIYFSALYLYMTWVWVNNVRMCIFVWALSLNGLIDTYRTWLISSSRCPYLEEHVCKKCTVASSQRVNILYLCWLILRWGSRWDTSQISRMMWSSLNGWSLSSLCSVCPLRWIIHLPYLTLYWLFVTKIGCIHSDASVIFFCRHLNIQTTSELW